MILFKAFLAQLLGVLVALSLMMSLPALFRGGMVLLFTQCIVAAISSKCLGQKSWWLVIHLLFLPSAIALLTLPIPAYWYLVALLVLLLIFWGTIKGDVPLFLSSAAVAETVIEIVGWEQVQRFADFGAGVGSVTLPLARHYPDMSIDAYEHAPLPRWIHAWRSRKLSNIGLYSSSFWKCDLSQYDVVFAFLSPAVMQGLGERVRVCMRPGSLFISSSFPVPDWEPEFIKQTNDKQKTLLYCYRVGFLIDY